MSYEPTNWKSGDTVTSAKLNKMEQGIANAGGVLFVTADNDGVLDHTWQEVADVGFAVYSENNDGMNVVASLTKFGVLGDQYGLDFLSGNDELLFVTTSPNDYPVLQQ